MVEVKFRVREDVDPRTNTDAPRLPAWIMSDESTWEARMAAEISDTELCSLRKVAFALDQFEPFPRLVIADSTLGRLVEAGLVESGRSCRPAVGKVGYRLTSRGWILAREHWPQRPPELFA
jgi:hypothetical protein